jgi:HEAT repeat protein
MPSFSHRLRDPEPSRGAIPSRGTARIVNGYRDPSDWVRYEACWVCERLGRRAAAFIGPLIEMTKEANLHLRRAAFCAIAEVGLGDAGCFILEHGLADEDSVIREASAKAAGRLHLKLRSQ